ncbi:hypothetical protein CBR_g32568 [Chara braunii]|uniref:Uncharacterized protein n=1 Tax=Chara braunii TaxID=69332 RepID=A0A388LGY9_CHABU|nr:hypothetical protein CBR_g32568 [Chara braunii]|eukprot:GBG81576.1 hypothetical protein CBR_g32568 [Chara braunii]
MVGSRSAEKFNAVQLWPKLQRNVDSITCLGPLIDGCYIAYRPTYEVKFDTHPSKPWIILVTGPHTLEVWNYEDGNQVGSWRVFGHAIKVAKFMTHQKEWVVMHDDHELIYVYEIHSFTSQRGLMLLRTIQSRGTYVADMATHRNSPYLLTGFRTKYVELWDSELGGWKRTALTGHSKPVVLVTFHPHDANIFATISGDAMVNVWDSRTMSTAQEPLEVCGAICKTMQFCHKQPMPFLILGFVGGLIQIWDYCKGVCVVKMEHTTSQPLRVVLRAAFYHPRLPFIFSASEEGIVKVWSELDYTLMTTYTSGLKRLCSMAAGLDSDTIVLGGDKSFVVVEVAELVKDTESVAVQQTRSHGQGNDQGEHVIRVQGMDESSSASMRKPEERKALESNADSDH